MCRYMHLDTVQEDHSNEELQHIGQEAQIF
jgi:hypothetical protein